MASFSDSLLGIFTKTNVKAKPTAFINLNEILKGGMPIGRLVEIYGRSQIGKSSLAISMFPDITTVYLDLSRKLCSTYPTSNLIIAPHVVNEKVFELVHEVIKQDCVVVIDDLTMLGNFPDDGYRYRWLMTNFMKLQRELIHSESIVLVLNQIRISPSTKTSYNPHEGCLDAAVKIKMHHAEKKGTGDLIYLDIEKHYWGQEGARCTLLVSKNKIEVPDFYKPSISKEEENFL